MQSCYEGRQASELFAMQVLLPAHRVPIAFCFFFLDFILEAAHLNGQHAFSARLACHISCRSLTIHAGAIQKRGAWSTPAEGCACSTPAELSDCWQGPGEGRGAAAAAVVHRPCCAFSAAPPERLGWCLVPFCVWVVFVAVGPAHTGTGNRERGLELMQAKHARYTEHEHDKAPFLPQQPCSNMADQPWAAVGPQRVVR